MITPRLWLSMRQARKKLKGTWQFDFKKEAHLRPLFLCVLYPWIES